MKIIKKYLCANLKFTITPKHKNHYAIPLYNCDISYIYNLRVKHKASFYFRRTDMTYY